MDCAHTAGSRAETPEGHPAMEGCEWPMLSSFGQLHATWMESTARHTEHTEARGQCHQAVGHLPQVCSGCGP
eukprot:11433775-Heterocapsa_arctica.AAC.1